MKLLLTALLLLSTTLFAEEEYMYKYTFDNTPVYFNWKPIFKISREPYWYNLYKQETKQAFWEDQGGAIQFGLRYDFANEKGFLQLKQEYATLPLSTFSLSVTDEEPVIIFEFKYEY